MIFPHMSSSLKVHEFGNPDAPTAILLHPGGALHSVWLPFIKRWSNNYYLLAPDLIVEQMSLDALATHVTTIIESCSKKKVFVIGSSLGANVALLVAARVPHRIAALVLDSAQSGGKPPNALKNIVFALKKVIPLIPKSLVISALLHSFRGYPDGDQKAIRTEIEGNRKTLFLEHIEIHFNYDATPLLKNISVPTLIIAGENDILTKSGEPDKLEQGIKFSKLELIPDAGHVTFLQQPALFEKTVSQFLNQNTP